MRFWQKFDLGVDALSFVPFLSNCILFLAILWHPVARSMPDWIAIFLILILIRLIGSVVDALINHMDLTSNGIRVRESGRPVEIPWKDVSKIEVVPEKWYSHCFLKISYIDHKPKVRRFVNFRPADPDLFLTTFSKHAPQLMMGFRGASAEGVAQERTIGVI